MLSIWHLRPALQRRFPLYRNKDSDWVRYLAWCATDGRREYAALRELGGIDELLMAEVRLPVLKKDEWEGHISLGVLFRGMARYRWSLTAMIQSPLARTRAARAFWRGERHEREVPTAPWQLERLPLRDGQIDRFLKMIFLARHHQGLSEAGIVEKFGLRDVVRQAAKGGVPSKQAHECFEIPRTYARHPFVLPLLFYRLTGNVFHLLRRRPNEAERIAVTGAIDTTYRGHQKVTHPFGVNLFGYARGELGIGEDIRQVAKALIANGVPVSIVNFEPGKNISQADRTVDHLIAEGPRYGINLFCMTGIETTRFVCERGGGALDGRYNIGLWPWELPEWPKSCRHAFNFVDEIWGISEYTANTYRAASPRPVHAMSLPVELGPVGKETRRDFGLPEDDYLFAFAFDINSSSTRKNPEGLIEAFQRAFPDDKSVGLVLKISHPETGCRLWRKIRRLAKRDCRIHIIEKTMRRPELLALFNACDCFVSLHRAEGFGRCLAEALLLGKQVVATGYSGNTDFCLEPRVALVRHGLQPVGAGEYMWGDGQTWAAPDLDHAAELMQEVRQRPRRVAEDDVDFSAQSVGARYCRRLDEIRAMLDI